MYEVRCQDCGKLLGVITDKKVCGTSVYQAVETVVFGNHGYIDGNIPVAFNVFCSNCSQSFDTTMREQE